MTEKVRLRNPDMPRPSRVISPSFPWAAWPGKVYLSLAEWKNKKELEEAAKFTSSGQLPPDIAPEVSRSDSEEEGNRLQRRMAKKEKRKSGKI